MTCNQEKFFIVIIVAILNFRTCGVQRIRSDMLNYELPLIIFDERGSPPIEILAFPVIFS
jgi:hypothetical protein